MARLNQEQISSLNASYIVLLTGESVIRASEALRIYLTKKESNDKISVIISGTNATIPDDYSQAAEMKLFLTERGVNYEDIIMEIKSRNTFESAKNIKGIIGDEPFFLVTSDYHLPRSILSFQQNGMKPTPAPAIELLSAKYSLWDVFPTPDNLTKANLIFHEYLGLVYYQLKN